MAKTRPKTKGTSASEKECALRRKLTWTTQISAKAKPSATAHHGRCGSAWGAPPCVNSAQTVAPTIASAVTYSHTHTSRDSRGVRRALLVDSSIARIVGACQAFLTREGEA